MNEKFKTLILIALCLMLLAGALHILFVQNLKNRLVAAQVDYELREFSTKDPDSAAVEAHLDAQLIITLENRLKLINILKVVLFISGVILFILAWFFREKNRDDFEDEWDEEWEDDDEKQ